MKCEVCGALNAEPVRTVRLVLTDNHETRKTSIEWLPGASPGIACSPVCIALLIEAQDQPTTTPYERYEAADVARRWRRRAAEVRGLPFNEPELKSPAEIEIERVCLMRWGRLPAALLSSPNPSTQSTAHQESPGIS